MPDIFQLLTMALDSRTPEGEAMNALRVARRQVPGDKAADTLRGVGMSSGPDDDGGAAQEISIAPVPVKAFQLINHAAYDAARSLKLKKFEFHLDSDPTSPTSAVWATVRFTFRSSSQQAKAFSAEVDEWIAIIKNDGKSAPKSRSSAAPSPKPAPAPKPKEPEPTWQDIRAEFEEILRRSREARKEGRRKKSTTSRWRHFLHLIFGV